MGAYRVRGCFAPVDLFETQTAKGQQSLASLIGNYGSEPSINLDYVKETHAGLVLQSPAIPRALPWGALPSHFATRVDWFDTGGRKAYVDILLARHKHLNEAAFKGQGFPWPDILTFKGPDLPRSQRDRHEFYEIKPDSKRGLRDGREKIKAIGEMYRKPRFALPYLEGRKYPSGGTKSLPLLYNRHFASTLRIFAARGGLRNLKLTLHVRRERSGLLLYLLCVELITDDEHDLKQLGTTAAKHLYASFVLTHAPERFAAAAKELGDYTYKGDPFPRIKCRFDVLDPIKAATQDLEQSMVMRGIGVPGDRFLLCCDESYYFALIKPAPLAHIKALWQRIQQLLKPWVVLAGGPGAWNDLAPYLARAQDIAKTVRDAFPGLTELADQVLGWIMAHPLETIGIVVTAVVVTAAVAAFAEPVLLAGAMVAGESTGAASATAATGLGEFAMTEAVATHAAPAAARRLAVRLSADQLARIGGAVAANDIHAGARMASSFMAPAAIAAQLTQGSGTASGRAYLRDALSPRLISKAAARTAREFEGGSLLGAGIVSAYDGAALSAGQPPKAGPFAQDLARLFIVKALATPTRGLRFPRQGESVNLRHFAQRTTADLAANPFNPSPQYARYIGTITVT